ncbi:MAG: DUF411 domain-containing protein [Rhodocyclales bacterium]|nr:DUF411 domain-containing protein [Rhodocyclales bacterium]
MKSVRLAITLFLLPLGAAWAQGAPHVEVYKSASCGCCGAWVAHLRQNGFEVVVHDVGDVPAARRRLGMPDRLGSCHSARLAGYAIEGHVPAADIRRLLKEKPNALGLAVPSMPPGSPGMESARPQPYDTLLVARDGSARVYASH